MDNKTFTELCKRHGFESEVLATNDKYDHWWLKYETTEWEFDHYHEFRFSDAVSEAIDDYSPENRAYEDWSEHGVGLRDALDTHEDFKERMEELLTDVSRVEREEEAGEAYDKRSVFIFENLEPCIVNAFDWVKSLGHEGDINDEAVIITCNNGYEYRVNVTMDSLGAMVEDVVRECLRH